MTKHPDTDIEIYLAAAARHGLESEPEHEVADLQHLLRTIWSVLTPDQIARITADPIVMENLEIGRGD